MGIDPKCSAIATAMQKKGLSYAQLASAIGSNEQHVADICSGAVAPTDGEFKALASALGMTDVPHTGVHRTS